MIPFTSVGLKEMTCGTSSQNMGMMMEAQSVQIMIRFVFCSFTTTMPPLSMNEDGNRSPPSSSEDELDFLSPKKKACVLFDYHRL